MISVEKAGVELLLFGSTASDSGVSAFTTTRNGVGGASPYASFNLGLYSGGDVTEVCRNLSRLAGALGVPDAQLCLPRQVHGVEIGLVDASFLKLDAFSRARRLDGVDALITNVPSTVVGVTTADCVPVLLYDPRQRVVAAAHAGWRGTAGRIASRCVERMAALYGTCAADVRAMIGPSISAACFEVGDEVFGAFSQAGFDMARMSFRHRDTGRYHLDLWEANRQDLAGAGVPVSQMETAGLCTFTQCDRFYSARRLTVHSGRFVTGIYLCQ